LTWQLILYYRRAICLNTAHTCGWNRSTPSPPLVSSCPISQKWRDWIGMMRVPPQLSSRALFSKGFFFFSLMIFNSDGIEFLCRVTSYNVKGMIAI
jgi:hypothetical protein